VTIVDKNVDAHGTRKVAQAYLNYLYTPEGQEIIAQNYYRPRNPDVAAKYASRFPRLQLFTIDRNFGGWQRAQAVHFNDGGLFDQIFEAAKR
jgi:sulfate transport system substrate-binding protein